MTKKEIFESECNKLVGNVLRDVYYEHSAPGFVNVRERGAEDFDYVPLSRLCFEANGKIFFEFSDSSRFLEHYGYYTLDLTEKKEMSTYFIGKSQAKYAYWKPYLNEKIEKVEIVWDHLREKHYKQDPDDLYPRSLVITFANKYILTVVAAELEISKEKYKFRIPDEALIIFFKKIDKLL